MKAWLRNTKWGWPALALVAAIAVGGVTTGFGLTKGAPPQLWTEQSAVTAQAPTVQAPDWVKIGRELKPAVVNVSAKRSETAMPEMQGPSGEETPFDRYFKDFFGSRPKRHERSMGSGFIINHQPQRLHRDQQPRGRRRHPGAGQALRRPRAARQGGRPRLQDRHRSAQGGGERPHGDPARRLVGQPGRRARHGHWQPLRPRSDRDHGHRERHGARHRLRSVRRLHPDGCLDQPRQQRRAAHQRARPGHRYQHGDLLADRRVGGHRVCHSDEPRQVHRDPAGWASSP